jgi:hypothetical protein
MGLGVAIIHLLDDALCRVYPVREVRLGRAAPVLQLVLVTRKVDDDHRALAVVRETLGEVLRGGGRA